MDSTTRSRSPSPPPGAAPPGAAPLPRVLCLHGFRQTAGQFGYRAATLRKRLRGVAALVFLDGPHALPDLAAAGARYADHTPQARPRRGWLLAPEQYRRRDAPGVVDGQQYRRQTAGWEESEGAINEALDGGGFDGLLGFSQGAAAAAAVAAAEARRPPAARRFRFVILCSGYLPPVPGCEAALEGWAAAGGVPLPSLHVFGGGGGDRQIGRPDSEALAACFAPALRQEVRHKAGHLMPSAREVTDAVAAFVQRWAAAGEAPQFSP